MSICRHCHKEFTITSQESDFYQKITVPPPKMCPDCRLQKRLCFRNDRHLYKRQCHLCKKNIISVYSAASPYTVYCSDCFWSDKWDPLQYGMSVNLEKPFFEQFGELMLRVPKANLLQLNNENCEFNSFLAFSKNSYMCPGSFLSENCFYVRKSRQIRDCLNSNNLNKCELVSDSTNCDGCYKSHHLINCRSCSFSSFLADSANAQNCFMCCGINKKNYMYKNEKYSKEDYEKILASYKGKTTEEIFVEFWEFCKKIPKKAQIQLNCENCSGDYIYNCKNSEEVYDSFYIEDSKYILECVEVKDSMDLSFHDKEIELCYELCSGGEKSYQTKFSFCACSSPYSEYLFSCFYLAESFGCDGIHERNKNCILNKHYSKEEYTELKKKIVEQLMKRGEYGEFFPAHLSPFGYNESIAQDYFPLKKAEALSIGFKWLDEEIKATKKDGIRPAQTNEEITDDVCRQIYNCANCSANYKFLKQEVDLYKKIGVPLNKLCMECRFRELFSWKNPHKFSDRSCDKCGKKIRTAYPQNVPVYCEKCYLAATYQ